VTELLIDDQKLDISLKAQLRLSKLLREQNKLSEAIYTLQQALQLYPHNPEPYYCLGLLYTEIDNKQLAIDYYRRSLTKKPPLPAWVYSSLAKLLIQAGEIDEVIQVCELSLSFDLVDDAIYRCFGVAVGHKDNIQKMCEYYKKAIALNPNQPQWVYLGIAQYIANEHSLFDSLSNLELDNKKEIILESISYYQKSLEVSKPERKVDGGIYYELAHLLLKANKDRESLYYYLSCFETSRKRFGQYSELDEVLCRVYDTELNSINLAVENYQNRVHRQVDFVDSLKNYHRFGFLGKKGLGIDRPANYYFVNPQLKAIYCSIPKNACTLFKTAILEQTPFKEEFLGSKSTIHVYLDNNPNILFDDFIARTDSPEYFKFTILRNPLQRLVSAYLDKFVKHPYEYMEDFARKLVVRIYDRLGIKSDPSNSITFTQFVEHIMETKDRELNDHWKPQSSFIGSIEFDFIGQFENLNQTIDVLQNRFNIKIAKKVAKSSHITKYQEFDRRLEFHNMYPTELRQLAGMPKAEQLYTPELLKLVKERYANDIEIYEKTFQVKI
jgi:tetratricopeptide (TPR) repeat protein